MFYRTEGKILIKSVQFINIYIKKSVLHFLRSINGTQLCLKKNKPSLVPCRDVRIIGLSKTPIQTLRLKFPSQEPEVRSKTPKHSAKLSCTHYQTSPDSDKWISFGILNTRTHPSNCQIAKSIECTLTSFTQRRCSRFCLCLASPCFNQCLLLAVLKFTLRLLNYTISKLLPLFWCCMWKYLGYFNFRIFTME